jgi:hypothetical protein
VSIDRWYTRKDANPTVEAWKKRIRKRPRSLLAQLESQRTLGVVLLALGREREALAVWDEAATVAKRSARTDPWATAAACAALSYWVRPTPLFSKFDDAHAAISLQPELWTKSRFAGEIAGEWRRFDEALTDRDPVTIDTLAFHFSQVVFLRMIHVLAPIHRGKIAPRAVDAALRARLRAIAQSV